MIFPFKVIINTELCKYKISIKDKLHCNEQSGIYKIGFFWRLFFIWYWGGFELTAENRQGRNLYERRHILTIGFINKSEGGISLKGVNVVNILRYVFGFLLVFTFSIIDGDLLGSILLSLAIMTVPILFTFNEDKYASNLLVKKLNDNNE